MPIRVDCGQCHKAFAAPDHFAGKTVPCPSCRNPITVAGPEPQLPALTTYDQDLVLATSHSPAVNPILGPSPNLNAGKQSFRQPSTITVRGPADAYVATNRKFIAAMLVGTVLTLGVYAICLPTPIFLYLAGGAVTSSFLAVFFLATLPKQDRDEFDWLYKIAAFIPAGIFTLIYGIFLFLIAWGTLRGFGVPNMDVVVGRSIVFGSVIGVCTLIGAILLFCFRQFGFWRTYASSQIISLVCGAAYAPFFAEMHAEEKRQEMAKKEEIEKQRLDSERRVKEDQERFAKEQKERDERRIEETKIQSETFAKQHEAHQKEVQERMEAHQKEAAERDEKWHQDDFTQKLEWAIRGGKLSEARNWLYADCITREEADLLGQLRICSLLKRPVINLHWVMGVETTPLSAKASGDQNERAAQALGKAAVRNLSGWEQREIAKDFAQRAGTAGVAIGQHLSQGCLDGRYGPWGPMDSFDREALRGVTMLPAGTTDALIGGARASKADLLIAANVQVRPSTSRIPDASLIVRILNVASGKEYWRSEKLTTGQIAAAKRKGDSDPAASLAETAIAFIDDNVVLNPVPQLKPEAAQKRAAMIVADLSLSKLAVLAELRFYEQKQWLSREQALQHYGKILGPQKAKLLMSDKLTDRQSAVESLVVQ